MAELVWNLNTVPTRFYVFVEPSIISVTIIQYHMCLNDFCWCPPMKAQINEDNSCLFNCKMPPLITYSFCSVLPCIFNLMTSICYVSISIPYMDINWRWTLLICIFFDGATKLLVNWMKYKNLVCKNGNRLSCSDTGGRAVFFLFLCLTSHIVWKDPQFPKFECAGYGTRPHVVILAGWQC